MAAHWPGAHPPCWKLMAGQSLCFRTWDEEEFLLYNNLSGDTHLIDADAIDVLLSLQQQPAGAEALLALLEMDSADRHLLDGMLEQLCALSLIEAESATAAC